MRVVLLLSLAGAACETPRSGSSLSKSEETHLKDFRDLIEKGALRPDEARESVAKYYAMYRNLPSYRAMLQREGVESPGDVALVGTPKVASPLPALTRHVACRPDLDLP